MLMMKERLYVWRWAQPWKYRKAALILGNIEDGWLAWCWVPNLCLLKVHNEKDIIAYSILDLPGFLMVLILTLSSSMASTEFINLVKEKIRTLSIFSSHNKYNYPCKKCTLHVIYNLFKKLQETALCKMEHLLSNSQRLLKPDRYPPQTITVNWNW